MRAKTPKRSRATALLSVMLVLGLLAGLTTSALAGAGAPGATAAKKKKKKVCPAGTHKVVVKKKNGKKKKRCVADAPPSGPTTLAISPTTFAYPATEHGGACPGDSCPTQAFTVTNTGGNPSGVPATSITVVADPEDPDGPPAFTVTANTCTAAVPAGGSCTVTVGFHPNSNAGDQNYSSVLHVVATPGSEVQAALSGIAN